MTAPRLLDGTPNGVPSEPALPPGTANARDDRWWVRALTLGERAAQIDRDRPLGVPPREPGTDPLARWQRQRPFDQPDVLARRLATIGLTETDLAELIASPPTDSSLLPDWVQQLERARAIAHEIARLPEPSASDDPSGLSPVRALVEPFVTLGLSRLYSAAKAIAMEYPSAPFDPHRATLMFESLLWNQLIGRAIKVVVLELNVARIRGTLSGSTPEERCADYARRLRAGAVRDALIAEYPVLARSLVTATEFWHAAAEEFLRHLATDVDALERTFASPGQLGTLASLIGNAGDGHRHGRSVIIAEFSSGTRIVYKPRSLAVDRHFNALVDWLNARGQSPPLRGVRTIALGDHGWSEFVTTEPCGSVDGVERFYDRFGAYLALLYILNATDFHYENVIASGEHPMLVDLEALFHPLVAATPTSEEPEWLGWEALQRSVMRTGVLPFRAFDSDQSSGLDMSAMGGSGGQQTPNRFPVLVGAGTDEMRLERDFIRLPDAHNRPTLGDQPVDPQQYGGRVLGGFVTTYRLLLAHRDELLSPNGPIHAFSDDAIRIVLRPTRQYALILSESHHPDVLRDATERDRLIDRLWVAIPGRPELERVVPYEHEDLVNGDVPLFTSNPSSADLETTHGSTVPGYFRRCGLQCALDRIAALSERDVVRQRWIIEAALVALVPWHHEALRLAPTPADQPSTTPSAPRGAMPSHDETIDVARRIARRLGALALRDGERVSWLGLTLVRDRDWVIQPVGTDVYSGTAGIALFLAYAAHVTGDAETRTLARTVVSQIVRRIGATLDAIDPVTGLPPGSLGVVSALGGVVYSLSHIGALWADRSLIDAAHRIANVLERQIESDDQLDIIGGAAGYIMALGALEHVDPRASTRRLIALAAESLTSRANRVESGLSWTTRLPSTRPLAGMSHGASGMSLALLTAGRTLACTRYMDAASDAMRYERTLLDLTHDNWPDYRILDGRAPEGAPPIMWAWCHGAPGIGLARLAALGLRGPNAEPELLDDLVRALGSTASHGFGTNDSLCHGDLGNLDLFARALEHGYRGEWESVLATESARLIERVGRGAWRCGVPGGVETPGLMTGLAGVGYGLLRLAATSQVPSVLSFEPPRSAVAHAERRERSNRVDR